MSTHTICMFSRRKKKINHENICCRYSLEAERRLELACTSTVWSVFPRCSVDRQVFNAEADLSLWCDYAISDSLSLNLCYLRQSKSMLEVKPDPDKTTKKFVMTLTTQGTIFSRWHFEFIFLGNRLWQMSKTICFEKLSSAEFAQRVVNVKKAPKYNTKNRVWHFMQTVSWGDNLYEMSSKCKLWRQFARNIKSCFLINFLKMSAAS